MILTVPYQKVPHLSIRGNFAGKPFVRHVPIDLSALLYQSSCSATSSSAASTQSAVVLGPPKEDPSKVVHQLAAKSIIRDFERMALKELLQLTGFRFIDFIQTLFLHRGESCDSIRD